MTALRTATPTAKIGVAGFCWGGLYTVLLAHDTPANKVSIDGKDYPLINCAFTAHPSLLSIPAHLEAVVRPLSVANGDDDEFMGKEKMKVLVEILEGKNKVLGEERHEAVVYPGAAHGFSTRGDPKDPLQLERGQKSEQQAVRWFQRWFA
jgi:dienelactone hydrolase